MIGWMQNWGTSTEHDTGMPYFGQMSLPRELSIESGILYQRPVRELTECRGDKIRYDNIIIEDERISLEDVKGRCLELDLLVDNTDIFDELTISIACNESCHTDFIVIPKESVIKIDRDSQNGDELSKSTISNKCGSIDIIDNTIRLQFIIDRNSIELFVNDGKGVLTTMVTAPVDADLISFSAKGRAKISVKKYDLL